MGAALLVAGAVTLFIIVAFRFDLGHRPSVATNPVVPEMSPPGQIHIPNPEKEDPDA
jgi:DHA1 family tetracycline resistance protein-like MFS transporter